MNASTETTLAADRARTDAAVAEPAAADAGLTETPSAAREAWLDHAKGIGIILVVYGHLLSSDYHSGVRVPERFFTLSDSILYSFHMPLFFFLAGLTVAGSYSRRGPGRFVREKFVHLSRPYVIWSVVQVCAEIFFSRHAFQPVSWQSLLAVPIIPHEQYWFLYALLCAYLVYAGARAVRVPFAGLAALCAGLFVFPVHTEIAALDRVCTVLPFFLAGLALRGRFLHAAAGRLPEGRSRGVGAAFRDAGKASRRPHAPLARLRSIRAFPIRPAMLLSAAVLTAALVGGGAFVFTRFVPPIRFTEHANYAAYELAFLTLASLGLAACVAWAFALARAQDAGMRGVGVIALIGRYSMPIYLMHMLVAVPVRIALLRGAHLHSPTLLVATGAVVAIWVPIVAYRLCKAYGFGWLFE